MGMEEIRTSCPALKIDNHTQTSDRDFNYNCLAFALGDTTNWWEPPDYFETYWPPGFDKDSRIETVMKIIRLHGYSVELERGVIPITEAVAIYSIDGEQWEHFAKYIHGQWMSKVGDDHDISHATPDLLEGDLFGRVVKILSRPIT